MEKQRVYRVNRIAEHKEGNRETGIGKMEQEEKETKKEKRNTEQEKEEIEKGSTP